MDLEKLHFHEQVYEAYQLLIKKFPERIHTINADQTVDAVESEAFDCITTNLAKREMKK